jgi:histone H3/H4
MSSPVPSTDAPTKAAPSTIEFEPPLACVRRILKQSLPKSTHCGKDASQAFTRACGIFVIYLTTCANDIARENKRQTITANDVLAAIKVSIRLHYLLLSFRALLSRAPPDNEKYRCSISPFVPLYFV